MFVEPNLRLLVPQLRTIPPDEREQIPLYRMLIATVGALVVTLLAAGSVYFWEATRPEVDRIVPWIRPVLAVVGVASFLALGFTLMALRSSVRGYIRAQESLLGSTAFSSDYRSLARVSKQYEHEQEAKFRRNLRQICSIESLEWHGLRFFDNGEYRFASRVNVLLGKNGYGKTLLLRTLAALIKSDLEHSMELFSGVRTDTPEAAITLNITRDGQNDKTVRDPEFFEKSAGPVPLLAIPDSRFVDRTNRVVGVSASGIESLASGGARHFLTQEPYQDIISDLLSQLGIEYLERRSRRSAFDAPIFRLIEEVFQDLTEDEQFMFHSISRVGRTGFEILVTTTGSEDSPYPIQLASQGTLSVLATVGLIYSFLRSLQPTGSDSDTVLQSGIVIIDELDAHLHPNWQQKIVWILTRKFPNVQFILSAHSPTIVAGCDWGEVAVLRRNKESRLFSVETLDRDFMGATTRDLYNTVFEIDDFDRTYLEYATKSTLESGSDRAREIEKLEAKQNLSPQDDARLTRLVRDERLIRRVAEVRTDRIEELERELQILRSAEPPQLQ